MSHCFPSAIGRIEDICSISSTILNGIIPFSNNTAKAISIKLFTSSSDKVAIK